MKRLLVLLMLLPAISLAEPIAKTIQDAASKMTLSSIQSLLGVEYYLPSKVFEDDQMYIPIRDDRPKVGETYEVYMGDIMTQQRTGIIAECFYPFFYHKDRYGFWDYEIKENIPLCKEKKKSKNFTAPYLNTMNEQGYYPARYPLRFSGKKEGKYKICFKDIGISFSCKKNLSSNEFHIGQGMISKKNNLQKMLEYSGKSGDIVSFVYSEFYGGMYQERKKREFNIDLNEGNIIAYKGALIEIVDVSGIKINYKVMRHFR